MKGEVAAHFAERASEYTRGTTWVNDPVALSPIVEAVGAIGPDVLEVGSGTGAVARACADRGALLGRYVGVDLAHSMLMQSHESCDRLVGDAHQLPFATAAFDTVLCRQSYHYFERPSAALAEIARVLRPGGRLIIAQIVPFDDPDDQAWWRDVVALRQPLRRDRSTVGQLVTALCESHFAYESIRFLDRPTSLNSWLDRYPIDSNIRALLVERFAMAPIAVTTLRGFKPTANDIEYLLRWAFITVRPIEPAVDESQLSAARE